MREMAQFIRRKKMRKAVNMQLFVQIKEATCNIVRLRVRMMRAALSIADEDGDIVSAGQPLFTFTYSSVGEGNEQSDYVLTLSGIAIRIRRRVNGQTVIVGARFLRFE